MRDFEIDKMHSLGTQRSRVGFTFSGVLGLGTVMGSCLPSVFPSCSSFHSRNILTHPGEFYEYFGWSERSITLSQAGTV